MNHNDSITALEIWKKKPTKLTISQQFYYPATLLGLESGILSL